MDKALISQRELDEIHELARQITDLKPGDNPAYALGLAAGKAQTILTLLLLASMTDDELQDAVLHHQAEKRGDHNDADDHS
ncbi:hypothetical protein [Schleiferilactobacillus shenzhenensis]|uniref:Uncharacterized protein n=1 Tax=Schleiferilactobacillus shenzhenensis LY-73 TaxID=1231336 RepID=U4TQ33_9LACO|nr:hypothetical protein [Schleiferilactobacillus shenzhenensis]ERL64008.1 hypothetical protein L248_1655 [Schleiferilactobacillus shenzhenensis LY-73]